MVRSCQWAVVYLMFLRIHLYEVQYNTSTPYVAPRKHLGLPSYLHYPPFRYRKYGPLHGQSR